MDHGQAAYYPAAPLLGLRESDPELFLTLWQGYTWLWFMAAVLAAYGLGRALGLTRTMACAAALLFYLSPRFFAEGHYNNKDIVLMALSLCTITAGARFLQKPGLWRGLWFAAAGALAANTRIIGLFVFGVMGVVILVSLAARRALSRRVCLNVTAGAAGFLILFTFITPAFLANPVGYVSHVAHNAAAFSRWTGLVIFKGFAYDPSAGLPLPHSYLPTMIALTVPVWVLALAAIGGAYAVFLLFKNDARRPVLAALLVLLFAPLAYAVVAQPLMYNGWRHFYFLYGPIVAFAALGLQLLYNQLVKSRWGKAAGAAALALLFVYQGVGIVLNHPYQYAYYNELAGDVQNNFELDYWEVSTRNALQILAETQERNRELPLTLAGADPLSLFSLNQSVTMLPAVLRAEMTVTEEPDASYLFQNSTYAAIYQTVPGDEYRELFTIQSYGNTLCTVYERGV